MDGGLGAPVQQHSKERPFGGQVRLLENWMELHRCLMGVESTQLFPCANARKNAFSAFYDNQMNKLVLEHHMIE